MKMVNMVVAFVLCQVSLVLHAHEVETHEKLSAEAVVASVIESRSEVLADMGLKKLSEQQTFPSQSGQPRTIVQLVQDGSRFEDNNDRPRNHFYDPLHDRPLTILGVSVGNASPDWALESPHEIGSQHYSLRDARDYLYRALTSVGKSDREKNFGLIFQTLGHVIHHLQDMAQPQHVRNDAHCDAIFPCLIPGGLVGLYSPSKYEKYTREIRNNLLFVDSRYNSDQRVMFPTARKFWTDQGRGLADFTNANFLSAGTNFDPASPGAPPAPLHAKDYAKPEWNGQIRVVDVQALMTEAPECRANGYDPTCGYECGPPPELPPACGLTGRMEFYATDVDDKLRGTSETNPRASTVSIFDQDLKPTGRRAFALNRFNFEATYPFLLPKAVAYSAGLLDFFFRGRLEVNDVREVDGRLRVEVRNVSGDDSTEERSGLHSDAADAGKGG